jgi:hypothetical protein
MMSSRLWIWVAAGIVGLVVFDGSATVLEQFISDNRLASGVAVGLGLAACTFFVKGVKRKLAERRHFQDR